MQLYTSYWSNKDLANLDAVKVAISRGKPRWRLPFRYKVLGLLAPSREAFSIEDPDEFERVYRAGLEEIGLEKILGGLERISRENGNRALILLCYEQVLPPKNDWCHRIMLSRWLEEQLRIEVPELVPGMLPKRSIPDQEALF